MNIREQLKTLLEKLEQTREICPDCGNSGRITNYNDFSDSRPCPNCTGKVPKHTELREKIDLLAIILWLLEKICRK